MWWRSAAAVASKATGRLVDLQVREGSVLRRATSLPGWTLRRAGLAVGHQAGVQQAEAVLDRPRPTWRRRRPSQALAEDNLHRVRGLAADHFVSPQAVETALTQAAARRPHRRRAGRGGHRAGQPGPGPAQVQVQQVNRDFTEIRAPFDCVVLVKNANGRPDHAFSNASVPRARW
jgi:hypothetical protein